MLIASSKEQHITAPIVLGRNSFVPRGFFVTILAMRWDSEKSDVKPHWFMAGPQLSKKDTGVQNGFTNILPAQTLWTLLQGTEDKPFQQRTWHYSPERRELSGGRPCHSWWAAAGHRGLSRRKLNFWREAIGRQTLSQYEGERDTP